ncbi:MAG: hypothetical protein JWM98_2486 [Thermoleophilia bacterium]|nr:hypothetical protein [Thermoleophilia bacterium]
MHLSLAITGPATTSITPSALHAVDAGILATARIAATIPDRFQWSGDGFEAVQQAWTGARAAVTGLRAVIGVDAEEVPEALRADARRAAALLDESVTAMYAAHDGLDWSQGRRAAPTLRSAATLLEHVAARL